MIAWALIGLGAVLRIRQFLFNRSIWNDEAEFALAALNRGFLALSHPDPLDTAPLGFSWVEKLAVELFGTSERAFRLVPLICALLGLLAFRALATKVLPGWPAVAAIALFSLSPSLIYYSAETKPYGFDVTALVVIFLLFLRLNEREVSWPAVIGWGAVLAVLDWCSFPALFATVITSILLLAGSRDRVKRTRLLVGSSIWVVSLAAEYLVTFRPLHGSSDLINDWVGGYPPQPLQFTGALHWLWSSSLSLVGYPLNLDYGVVALFLLVVGLVMAIRRQPPAGVFMLLVIAATGLSGLAHAYPVSGRLELFLVPISCLLLGSVLTVPVRGISRGVVVGLTLLVCVSLLSQTVAAAVHPYTKNEGREALRYAVAHRGPHGAVLIEGSGVNVYSYYHESTGITATANIWLYPGAKAKCDPTLQTQWFNQFHSIWIVFGGAPGTTPAVLDSYLHVLKGRMADPRVVAWPGAWDLHFELSSTYVSPVPEPSGPNGQYVCVGLYILPKS